MESAKIALPKSRKAEKNGEKAAHSRSHKQVYNTRNKKEMSKLPAQKQKRLRHKQKTKSQ